MPAAGAGQRCIKSPKKAMQIEVYQFCLARAATINDVAELVGEANADDALTSAERDDFARAAGEKLFQIISRPEKKRP